MIRGGKPVIVREREQLKDLMANQKVQSEVLMQFWKMHGLGNDYVVIDNRDQKITEDKVNPVSEAAM